VITSIALQRFRGFHEAHLELKPLTVLLGPNSAGKSSFLHAVAALHFIRRFRISPATLLPDGRQVSAWPFDFGTRETLQTKGTIAQGAIGFEFGVRVDGRNARIAYEFGRRGSTGLDLSAIEIDEQPALQGGAHSDLQTTIAGTAASSPPVTTVSPIAGSTEPRIRVRDVGHDQGFWQGPADEHVVVGLKNLELDVYWHQSKTLFEVTSPAQQALLETLERSRYLRATRTSPRRKSEPRPDTGPDDDVGPVGEWTGDTWLSYRAREVSVHKPPPARIDRETAAKLLYGERDAPTKLTFDNAVDYWLNHLAVAETAVAKRVGDSVAIDVGIAGEQRSLSDVGFGVGQVLPIIVQALALPPDGMLLVEQPEAQLHPRPQAQLADFFCSQVLEGRNFLIETHSESFFRRLHLRALLDPELAEKIAVYFIEPVQADGCCKPAPVALGADGAVEWPAHFLAESVDAHAAFAAVRAALAKRTRSKEGA